MIFNSKKSKLNNTGQALVEMALILPFLLFLTFAIIEFGRYLFIKNTATNGARQGARTAAVTPLPWDAAKKRAIYSAATSIKAGSTPWDPLDDTKVPVPTKSGDTVSVTVSKPFNVMPMVKYFIPSLNTKLSSISAKATMRFE